MQRREVRQLRELLEGNVRRATERNESERCFAGERKDSTGLHLIKAESN